MDKAGEDLEVDGHDAGYGGAGNAVLWWGCSLLC